MNRRPVIAIIGPGLLGGSLAMALRARHPDADIRLWARRPAAVAEITSHPMAVSGTTSLSDAVNDAEWVIMATPVRVMPVLAAQIATADFANDCLITDVGSVKGALVHQLEEIFSAGKGRFIGSHPMAGSEKTGLSAAKADLFQGANCIVTPTDRSLPADVQSITAFWQSLGCRVLSLSPEEHDEKIARISHLPHLVAAVTTLAALRSHPDAIDCSGGGFRDSTRVASGDPELWTGIIRENQPAVLAALRDEMDTLRELLEIIEGMDEGKLRDFLAEAKSHRDRLPSGASIYGND